MSGGVYMEDEDCQLVKELKTAGKNKIMILKIENCELITPILTCDYNGFYNFISLLPDNKSLYILLCIDDNISLFTWLPTSSSIKDKMIHSSYSIYFNSGNLRGYINNMGDCDNIALLIEICNCLK
eukprot:TRINITY_DN4502_c0_g1_i1.p1 TRINITY_DN4502_c0_g1~~TRINITY_DN4502_c0_g1_i1.p1  ORF type:complete len:126 (-),score=14.83 TRINITY_DN4502_c0_g1_i1:108-485(-)